MVCGSKRAKADHVIDILQSYSLSVISERLKGKIRCNIEELEKKSSPGTVNTYSAAIRFFIAVTFNRTLNYLQIPRQKKRKTFPEILTREEVSAIIESCQSIKHKAMLMVVYSSGLRVSEAAALKIQHIDSKTMRLFVNYPLSV